MQEHSEQEILSGCRKQQRYWQEQLHRRYYGVLLKLCVRYARSQEDAEQLVQDGFLRIFSKIDTYKQTGSFEGWMKHVTVNICLDYLRTKAARTAADLELNPKAEEVHESSLVQDGLQQLAYKDLLSCIQELPDTTRIAFNLFVFDGYTHKQIADTLGISEGTSTWHVHNARKLLQKRILQLNLQNMSYAGK
jgi:RNA polymerase sigma-70 factor (ECF subfamily)